MSDEDFLVAEIPKNSREMIRVMVRRFRGQEFIDLRIFVDIAGEPKATAKGVAIRHNLVIKVVEALLAAEHVSTQGQANRAVLR